MKRRLRFFVPFVLQITVKDIVPMSSRARQGGNPRKIAAGLLLCAIFAGSEIAQTPVTARAGKEGMNMAHAAGSFEIELTTQKPDNPVEQTAGSGFARRTSEKQFHGDLEGTSVGEMLGLVTETKGSAAYVALEWVTGKLGGRAGTFVFQHSATMTRGEGQPKITVVPDSATGELVGLSGSMMIKIEEGKHFYEFDYSLPAKQ